jgi:hypothetical protein
MDGTKENPVIRRFDKNYKLALYLGYKLNGIMIIVIIIPINGYFHVIEPMFKKII